MYENNLLRKVLVFGMVVLSVVASVIPSISGNTETLNSVIKVGGNIPHIACNESDAALLRTIPPWANLSGNVTGPSMNPIEGVRVRVIWHGTEYAEDYTDSSGYYHVTNIPTCFCLKNATASKEGYTNESFYFGISEDMWHDFILTPLTEYNGSLSGYVTDQLINPLEGARVQVSFHGTYEENYTNSSGYYHVTNIPICYCLKNATAFKEGYITEWVLLSIDENTTHDFVLTPSPICGDCNGDTIIDIGDVITLIHIFTGGTWPDPWCTGDTNGDGIVNVGDLVYLINYLFLGASPPVDGCCG